MPQGFDEDDYRRRLIAGGIAPNEAAALAAKTAALRRPASPAPSSLASQDFTLTAPAPPASEAPKRKPTVIQMVAERVTDLADQRRAARAGKPAAKTAAAALAGTVEQAQEAATLRATKAQIVALQLSLFDIAPWPDHMRGMPNDFGRSALFTARNKRTQRAELKEAEIFHLMKDVRITYTGTELRTYDDELVWLQVMEYAKRVPVGHPVTFTFYEFCKALDWPVNGSYYKKIEDCLTRLQTNSLKFSSKRVGRLESLSLIRRFGFMDQTDTRKSRCQVWLEEEIVMLFAGEHYAKFVWEKYRKLSGIARRMYDYFATHKEPFPLSLENFQQLCKSDTATTKKWRELVREARQELQDSGLVTSVWVKDDQIFCER